MTNQFSTESPGMTKLLTGTQGIEQRLLMHKDHLAFLASTLLGLVVVLKFVRNGWGSLKHIAMCNSFMLHTSARDAAKCTKARQQRRDEGRYDRRIISFLNPLQLFVCLGIVSTKRPLPRHTIQQPGNDPHRRTKLLATDRQTGTGCDQQKHL